MPPSKAFRKVLSLNDTGETGAHVAGLLVPKTELDFFPRLNQAEKNPRAAIVATDPSGKTWELNFIYYNNEQFGGTRNEYRLTGLTKFFEENSLRAGDTVLLESTGGGYRISTEKTDPAQRTAGGKQEWFSLPDVATTNAQPEQHSHSIRPAARIIHTIGQNLIKDVQAAVIELVKNSYDADARNVSISIVTDPTKSPATVRIVVEDDGHGMTYQHVTETWLVPATPDKATRRVSPAGRRMQGNKGIGRFAAFLLGEEVFLRTIAKGGGTETSLLLQASDFQKAKFLDEVRVLVDCAPVGSPNAHGTSFEMTSSEGTETFRIWSNDDFRKLRLDLRRMLFPLTIRSDDEFKIALTTVGFEKAGQPDGTEEIEPLPVMEQFDYRIVADVDDTGRLRGFFQSPLVVGRPEETLDESLSDIAGAPCGPVHVDLRVIDREPVFLQELIDRSKSRGDILGETNRTQLRRMLDESCGILVFRGNFRIRPYGDQGDDWMELDRERINNPSLAISNNQVFGIVSIAPEEVSRLVEKSARDGLKENEHYERLRAIVRTVVQELQRRRFSIRRSVGRIQKTSRTGEMLLQLKDYERPFTRIATILKTERVDPGKIDKIQDILKEEQRSRAEIVAKLEETIAVYQGQATLGKVVGIVLHEGNRGIGILKTQSRRIPELLAEWRESPGPVLQDEIIRAMEGVRGALALVSELFDRIQPLGVRSRSKKGTIPLARPIKDVLYAFEVQLEEKGIGTELGVPADFMVTAWENDLKAIFFNLVENSIYWLTHPAREGAVIRFRLERDQEAAVCRLHIEDNGPGIPLQHVANEDIFEPHFSLRQGIGLGLPIAGEAANRNGFALKAVHSTSGAHFILDLFPPSQNA